MLPFLRQIGQAAVANSGPTGSHLITTVNCHSSFHFQPRQFRRIPASLHKQPNHRHSVHRHYTDHGTQSKLTLHQRRQYPPTNEQPAHKRIHPPSACSHNVQNILHKSRFSILLIMPILPKPLHVLHGYHSPATTSSHTVLLVYRHSHQIQSGGEVD